MEASALSHQLLADRHAILANHINPSAAPTTGLDGSRLDRQKTHEAAKPAARNTHSARPQASVVFLREKKALVLCEDSRPSRA